MSQIVTEEKAERKLKVKQRKSKKKLAKLYLQFYFAKL